MATRGSASIIDEHGKGNGMARTREIERAGAQRRRTANKTEIRKETKWYRELKTLLKSYKAYTWKLKVCMHAQEQTGKQIGSQTNQQT